MPLHLVQHPLVQHKIGLLREADLGSASFRRITSEIAMLLAYEATSRLDLEPATVQTWAGETAVQRLAGKKLTIVPILRAGLGLLDGVLQLVPSARVSVVGLYRDERTLQPVAYFDKLAGEIEQRHCLVVDPMLATGGSLAACITLLKERGAQRISALTLVCAPEGLAALESAHPDVTIYSAALDSHLDENGYIRPGLGDAGDRLFGTR